MNRVKNKTVFSRDLRSATIVHSTVQYSGWQ
jgi:hypothetical protein